MSIEDLAVLQFLESLRQMSPEVAQDEGRDRADGSARCPRCRGPLETRMDGGDHWIGPVSAGAWCRGCGEAWREAEDFEHLAHWEPRDRLPTDEEVQALRRRHGVGAGWMIRSTDSATPRSYSRPVFLEGDSDLLPGLRRMVSEGIYRLTCWPVTAEGRPVGWPEVTP